MQIPLLVLAFVSSLSLGALPPSGDPKLDMQKLSAKLGSKDDGDVVTALVELGKCGEKGVDPLLRATKDGRGWVRTGAWLGIATIGRPALRVLPKIVDEAKQRAGYQETSLELAFALFQAGIAVSPASMMEHAVPLLLGEKGKSKPVAEKPEDQKREERSAIFRAAADVGANDLDKLLALIGDGRRKSAESGVDDLELVFARAVRTQAAP